MKYLKLIIILLFAFIISCSEGSDSGDKAKDLTSGVDEYSASGTVTDGICNKGGFVYVSLLDQLTLNLTPDTFPPVLLKDFGEYDLEVTLDDPLVRVDINASCHDETTGMMMDNRQLFCYNDLSTENTNVNPLCMITAPRTKLLFNTVGPTFQDFDLSEQQANDELYSFFDVSGITDRFTSLSLDSTSDANGAYLHMVAGILQKREDVDQISLITDLAYDLEDNGIIDNAVSVASITASLQAVDYFNIKRNVNDKFLSLGSDKKAPPAYKFGDHDNDGVKNVADQDFAFEYKLLEDKVKITFGLNLTENDSTKEGIDNWRFFAHPFIFDEDMEADMIVFNTSGQYLSVYDNDPSADAILSGGEWTVGPAPKTELKTILPIDDMTVLNELTLSDIHDATYDNLPNNFIGKLEFTFIAGVKYWIVLWSDDIYRPWYGNNGVPFNNFGGRALSTDGITWKVGNGISLDEIRFMFTN